MFCCFADNFAINAEYVSDDDEIICDVVGAREDINFEWYYNGKYIKECNTNHLQHIKNGRYDIFVIEKVSRRKRKTTIDIISNKNIIVREYIVTHASSDTARDGIVVANIENLKENVRFLWTNGIITNEPVLHDVRPGMYGILPITNETIEHHCSPVVLNPSNL